MHFKGLKRVDFQMGYLAYIYWNLAINNPV